MAGKIFAGELISEELAFGMSLAPETAGLSIPLTFASIGVTTLIQAGKIAHKQRQQIKDAEKMQQELDDRLQRIREEQRQQQLEQIAQQQERDRLKAEDDARVAEQLRIEAEQLARQQAQEQAQAQRNQEDQDYQNQIQVRNQAIEDQLALDRAQRLRGRNVEMNAIYHNDPRSPLDVIFQPRAESENWYLVSGNRLNPPGGLPYLDPYRARAENDNPNLPYPDGDAGNPDDWNPPGGGGAGGGGAGGGGGPGYPGNDPANNNFNQQGRPNRQGGSTYFLGNPFSDVIKGISDKIAQNRERERPPPNPELDQPTDQNILGKDGHGQWMYDPNRPENQKPYAEGMPGYAGGGIYHGGDIPGKGGSGTYNPQNPYITKDNDDVNLMENELLAIINNQGLAELNQEDIAVNTRQTINELQRLENQISGLLPQAQVGPSSVFTSAISRF